MKGSAIASGLEEIQLVRHLKMAQDLPVTTTKIGYFIFTAPITNNAHPANDTVCQHRDINNNTNDYELTNTM